MKKFNFLLAFLFLLIPFLGSAQKRVFALQSLGDGGNLFKRCDNISGDARRVSGAILINQPSRNSSFIFPAEGDVNAVPIYIVLKENATGNIVGSVSLNGTTFNEAPGITGQDSDPYYATDCSALYREYSIDFILNDCPDIEDLSVDGLFIDYYTLAILEGDNYEEPTTFSSLSTPYMQSLFGYGPDNENQCITYETYELGYCMDCNGHPLDDQLDLGYISIENTNEAQQQKSHDLSNKINDELPISVTPNPFSENIIISNLLNKDAVSINIFDANGRIIESFSTINYENSEKSISTFNWSTGFYIVRIETKEGIENLKLLKF